MKTLRLLILLSFVPMSAVGQLTDMKFLHGLGDVDYHHVESEPVGRAYHIYVMKPDGYDDANSQKYPTIYLLDGGALFPMMTAYYRYLNFGEEVPDAIIVGISYGNDDFGNGNFRSTDYTAPSTERDSWGGAANFQEFLSDELMPLVENAYRSDASRRVIFGQSIGGQFVLYSALTEPNLFWGHIASNPALHRNLPFFLELHGEADPHKDRSRLFVADGTLNDARFREPALQWTDHWSAMENLPWELKTTDLAGHSHMSAPPASFREGMRWLFSL